MTVFSLRDCIKNFIVKQIFWNSYSTWVFLQAIQDDFVEMRKTDHKSMTVEDFHTLLNLVRYVYIMLFTIRKVNYYCSLVYLDLSFFVVYSEKEVTIEHYICLLSTF